MKVNLNTKLFLVIAITATIAGGMISVLVQKPPSTPVSWELNDDGYTYTIRGVTNFGRGSTYYLYRERDGVRDVVLVDPNSSVDLTLFTDRPVLINGIFIARPDGVPMVRINSIRLKG